MLVVIDGERVRVEDADLLGEGGEGRVFRLGKLALKVFHARIAARTAKLLAFPRGLPAGVVAPLQIARDPACGDVSVTPWTSSPAPPTRIVSAKALPDGRLGKACERRGAQSSVASTRCRSAAWRGAHGRDLTTGRRLHRGDAEAHRLRLDAVRRASLHCGHERFSIQALRSRLGAARRVRRIERLVRAFA